MARPTSVTATDRGSETYAAVTRSGIEPVSDAPVTTNSPQESVTKTNMAENESKSVYINSGVRGQPSYSSAVKSRSNAKIILSGKRQSSLLKSVARSPKKSAVFVSRLRPHTEAREKRWHFSKILPGRKLRYQDVLGNGEILYNNQYRKLMGHTGWVLQLVAAFSILYQKEKLFCFWVLHFPFVFLTKAEAVEDALKNTKMMEKAFFYKYLHPWLGTGLLTSGGSKWKTRRKLITPAFHFDILKDFIPVFNEQSQILVERLKKETEKDFINIIEHIKFCSLDIVCETILGVSIHAQVNNQSEYVKAVHRATEFVAKRISNYYLWFDFVYGFTENGKQFKRDLKILHDFTRFAIQEKKEKLKTPGKFPQSEKKRKALMDLLLEQNIQTKSLTDEDIREEVDTFAFEGHDSTSMAISWCLYLLGLNKDVQEKVVCEIDSIFGDDCERPFTSEDLRHMKYLDCVIKEALRLYPTIPIIARQSSADVNICGYPLPEGTTCFIMPYIIHRDADVFPNPEKFDPDRFLPGNSVNRNPYAYIPFSAGPRNCIGQRFAMVLEKVVISTFLRHFTVHSLDQRDKLITTVDILLRPSGPLRVKILPRNLSS